MTSTEPSPKLWYALDVEADPAASDAVEEALACLDSIGTEIDRIRKKLSDPHIITGYFLHRPEESVISDALISALTDHGLNESSAKQFTWRVIENQDWLQEWKKHWKPTRVGRFVVAPPWEELDEEGDCVVIRIEPSMAFGTGTHETTKLCLKAIDENYSGGMSFLDVGTGTGILAIAAAKIQQLDRDLGNTRPIAAYDTDKESIRIANENAERNDVIQNIEFVAEPVALDAPIFDFVCANLALDVILPILPLLLEKTRRTMVLSGIPVEQETQIIDELKMHVRARRAIERAGEWISVLVRR